MSESVLKRFAREYDIQEQDFKRLRLDNFELSFFDSGNEVGYFKNSRYLIILFGELLNRDLIQSIVKSSSKNDAELMLKLFERNHRELASTDGHLSCVLFDAHERSLTLIADRFLRHSIVYSASDQPFVSSHSRLLYPFLPAKSFDNLGFSQSVHYRWMTGERRLFEGIRQVLPGTILRIEYSGKIRSDTFFQPSFDRESSGSQKYWMRQVDRALDRSLASISRKHDVIGVPLSGGVDSSLLLAKAKEHFKDCVAVTPRFEGSNNPELVNAKYFAKHLGVRHVIVDIDDAFVRDFFPVLVRCHEQPPRNYSDIALAKAIESLSTEVDAFLYGEAADTYFGTRSIHRIMAAYRKSLPLQVLPTALRRVFANALPNNAYRFRELRTILSSGIDECIGTMGKIQYGTPPSRVFACSEKASSDQGLSHIAQSIQLDTFDRASIQSISTSVVNHIENTGRLATHFGLKMYAPFVLNDTRQVAERLPAKLQHINGEFKDVLRKLACQYFEADYIYSKKLGFPTPTSAWMSGPLNRRVMASCKGTGAARRYYSADALAALSMSSELPLFWYAICLDELIADSQNDDI